MARERNDFSADTLTNLLNTCGVIEGVCGGVEDHTLKL